MTNVTPYHADYELLEHARQGRIESRGRRWLGDRFGEPEPIQPEEWIDAESRGWGSALQHLGEFQQVEFHRAQLLALYPLPGCAPALPGKPTPKRPKGTGYDAVDAPILEKMHELRAKQPMSVTEAAGHFFQKHEAKATRRKFIAW